MGRVKAKKVPRNKVRDKRKLRDAEIRRAKDEENHDGRKDAVDKVLMILSSLFFCAVLGALLWLLMSNWLFKDNWLLREILTSVSIGAPFLILAWCMLLVFIPNHYDSRSKNVMKYILLCTLGLVLLMFTLFGIDDLINMSKDYTHYVETDLEVIEAIPDLTSSSTPKGGQPLLDGFEIDGVVYATGQIMPIDEARDMVGVDTLRIHYLPNSKIALVVERVTDYGVELISDYRLYKNNVNLK